MSGRIRAALAAATVAVIAGATALSLSAVSADAAPDRPDAAPDRPDAAQVEAPAREPIFGDLFGDHHAGHDAEGGEGSEGEHEH